MVSRTRELQAATLYVITRTLRAMADAGATVNAAWMTMDPTEDASWDCMEHVWDARWGVEESGKN
jgi:mannose-6-phosphate isomerase-like protein (cupin superfamily)